MYRMQLISDGYAQAERAKHFFCGTVFGAMLGIGVFYGFVERDSSNTVRQSVELALPRGPSQFGANSGVEVADYYGPKGQGWVTGQDGQSVIYCVQIRPIEVEQLTRKSENTERLELCMKVPLKLMGRVRQVAFFVGDQPLPQGERISDPAVELGSNPNGLIESESVSEPALNRLGWQSTAGEATLIVQVEKLLGVPRENAIVRVDVPSQLFGRIDKVAFRIGSDDLPRRPF